MTDTDFVSDALRFTHEPKGSWGEAWFKLWLDAVHRLKCWTKNIFKLFCSSGCGIYLFKESPKVSRGVIRVQDLSEKPGIAVRGSLLTYNTPLPSWESVLWVLSRISSVFYHIMAQEEFTAWLAGWLFSCHFVEYLLSVSHFSPNVRWWKLSGVQEDFGVHTMKNSFKNLELEMCCSTFTCQALLGPVLLSANLLPITELQVMHECACDPMKRQRLKDLPKAHD